MRDALNENPVAQAVVVGVLLLAAAFLLMTQIGGKKKDTAAPVADTASTAVAAPSAVPAIGGTASFEPGPGLPRSLVTDHQQGRTIVLLIAKKDGLEDAPVRAAVDGLEGDPKLAVYVTDSKGIARYAQITRGVGVSQVPALIVVSPSRAGAGEPRATVSYGFRSAESVDQAVRDAVYRGVTRGYDPG